MLVTSQCNGNRVTGLYIGADNVRRYFPKKVSRIELQIDHLRIECDLTPHFWNGQPVIHDPRLCLWLESKQAQRAERRAPMPLAMTPAGEHCFTLGPVKAEEPVKIRSNSVLTVSAMTLAPDEAHVFVN
jgi:hypothetical protein